MDRARVGGLFKAVPMFAALGLALFAPLSHAENPKATFPEKHYDLLETYCLTCHDRDTEKGGINLEDLSFDIATIPDAELWQKVLNTLNSGEMPPEDKKQPDGDAKADFLDGLANTLVTARRILSDSGGEITIRRLNRREYQNTIEALTGVRVDASPLPSDGGAGTFDTSGSAQFISSDQIEQYLKLGRSAIDEMFARKATRQLPAQRFRVEPETTVNVQSLKDMKSLEEAQKRYLLWKAEVDKVAILPANQPALAKIREKYQLDADLELIGNLRLYQNTGLLEGAPDATKFGFRDGNHASFSNQGGYGRKHAYLKHYSELPHSDRGTYLKLAWGIQRIDVVPNFSKGSDQEQLPPGTYRLRIRAGAVEGSDPTRRFIEIGHPQRVNQVPTGFAGAPISGHQVTGTIEKPAIIETTVEIGADTPREFGIQERRPASNQATIKEFAQQKKTNGYGFPPAVWIDWIELEGPLSEVELAGGSSVRRIEPEKTINPANENEIAQIEDAYARFTRWQKGVDAVLGTPENKARIASMSGEKHIDHPTWFYRFADRLEGTPNPEDFGFKDSAKAAASHPDLDRSNLAYHKHYAALPHRDRGTYLKLSHGTGRVVVAPEKLPPGKYTLRVRAAKVEGSPAARHFIEVGHPQRLIPRNRGLEGPPISSHQVTGTIENPETIEIGLEVGSKTIREFAIQEKQPNNGNLKALWDAHNALKKENGYGHPPAIWIDWVELEGPHPSGSGSSGKWTQRREVEEHANAKVGGTYNGYFKGGNRKALEFLKTGQPQPGIADEREAKFRIRAFEENGPTHRRYLDDPLTKTGAYLTIYNLNPQEVIALPPEQPSGWKETKHVVEALPPGEYRLRFRIGTVKGTPAERHFVDLGSVPAKGQFHYLRTIQISGTTDEPQVIEVPVSLTKDGPRKFALREKRDPKGDQAWYRSVRAKTGFGPKPALWIDWVEWNGPLTSSGSGSDPLDWWITEATEPNEATRARSILEQFAFKALRGVEPGPEFIDRVIAIFETRRTAGDPFDTAIRLPLSIVLASPGFLYLNEPNDAEDRRQLTNRELAVRLAYFLWSAPPDQELLDLAKQNKLSQPEILRQQVDRLIADPRSDEFVSGFMHQWLDMERLDFFQFDPKLHREFDESTRSAARQEVYLSFAHLLRASGAPDDPNGGRLGKLLKSDTVFVNGLLANYYDIEGVTGDEFQKVSLPADHPRGGLLGMAAIHAMGSDGIESSPVERGAWVLRHLLHDAPPPAPANVPQLSRLAEEPLTTRQKLAAHQEEAQCASCHRKIDPIGFGLENFDAAGKWRTTEGTGRHVHDIDPSGAFHNGPAFADYFELRDLVAQREDDFARGFTEHLIGYGLGRPFGFTDQDLATEIMKAAHSRGNSVSEFIHTLVQSDAFHRK